MSIRSMEGISRKAVAVVVVSAGLVAAQHLQAGWGFCETWDLVKKWGDLEQAQDWEINLFGMGGQVDAIALGVDDDCDGMVDKAFFLGEKEKAEELLSTLPTEEVAFLGGVLTKTGWSGVTIIDPATFGDMILLSYGEPPASLNITAPVVIDISEPLILDKSSPLLYKALSFLLVASQACATRMEWDLDGDGTVESEYWGQNGPVFLGPVIPPGKRDLLITVTDNNVPPKTATMIVGGSLPETPMAGIIVIPNSNMGFKLNFAAMEGSGPLLSNMGFKLNYFMWQGGEYAEPIEDVVGAMGTWSGICNAWLMSSWILIPEQSPTLASVRFAGTGFCTVCGAFDGNLKAAVSVGGLMAGELEEISFTYSGSGRAAIFYAQDGWKTQSSSLSAQSARIDGAAAAAVIILESAGWTVNATIDPTPAGGGGEGGAFDAFLKMDGGRGFGFVDAVNWGAGIESPPWTWNYRTNFWENVLMDSLKQESLFVRGEVNLDSTMGPNISDVIFMLYALFLGGDQPKCLDAADVNDDGFFNISDVVAILALLFLGGEAKEPFPEAGTDPPPEDSLGCDLMN